MKIYLLIALFVNFYCIKVVAQNNLNLESIIPLVSKRGDVEKLLGKSESSCNCIYETQNETITVNYSEELCKNGWNVSKNTVLSYSIEPKSKISIEKSKINLSDFIKIADDAFFFTYVNLSKGVKIFTSPYGDIEKFEHIPTSANGLDKKLRCQNSPKYNPMNDVYTPALKHTIGNWNRDISVIDNLIFTFTETLDTKLYIFLYFSKELTKQEKSSYMQKFHKHFQKRLKLKMKDIKIVYGGIRKNPEIVAFILPETFPEPTPTPIS